ncbi:MAG: cyclic nucleotide-binding domain-containing protein [Planctomycetes bacterium]|nr:cyclic nucleotide-binding domain-containing protein [Planctomycetota bacterium]
MQDIINKSDFKKYARTLQPGEILFLQGDNSQDMYILISGDLEVLKDDKKIAEITEPGTTVGEMSFLLGSRKTATVKAVTEAKTVMIPADKIGEFLIDYPSMAPDMTQKLAKRLDETSRIIHGLREFCDQIPDSIIMVDKKWNILVWNQAAEKLHNRTWQQMKGTSLIDLYSSSKDFKNFVKNIQAGQSLNDEPLSIKQLDGNIRFISTSTTVLYDGHHNVEGYLMLSRDMTKIKELEKKYRRIRNWLIPASVSFVLITASIFLCLPYFSKGARILDYKKESFKNRIQHDSQTFSQSLYSRLSPFNSDSVARKIQDYFKRRNPTVFGINGILILNSDKRVVNAYSPKGEGDPAHSLIDTTYSGIKFSGDAKSPYKVLKLFRADKENPMGTKGVEIAYKMQLPNSNIIYWLIFQLDQETLTREYGIDLKILKKIKFEE